MDSEDGYILTTPNPSKRYKESQLDKNKDKQSGEINDGDREGDLKEGSGGGKDDRTLAERGNFEYIRSRTFAPVDRKRLILWKYRAGSLSAGIRIGGVAVPRDDVERDLWHVEVPADAEVDVSFMMVKFEECAVLGR